MQVGRPWLVIGDFKFVLRNEERSSGRGVSSNFVHWVVEMGLINLGFVGPIFTWCHGSNTNARRAIRLDRGVYDDAW